MGLTTSTVVSKWSLLIMFPSITNMVTVKNPANTCLGSTAISSLRSTNTQISAVSLSLSLDLLSLSLDLLSLSLRLRDKLGKCGGAGFCVRKDRESYYYSLHTAGREREREEINTP